MRKSLTSITHDGGNARASTAVEITDTPRRNRSMFAESLAGFHKNDVAIARMAIGLADLTAAESRVASALLGHFNTKTGQCYPSAERLSELLGIDVKTVRRALISLEVTHAMFAKKSFRGKYDRKWFVPNWCTFRAVVAKWDEKMRSHSVRFTSDLDDMTGTKMSTPPGQKCPAMPDKNVHLTNSNNPFEKTLLCEARLNGDRHSLPATDGVVVELRPSRRQGNSTKKSWHRSLGTEADARVDAARKAAEARLNTFVVDASRSMGPEVWELKAGDWSQATEAEMNQSGAGAEHLQSIWVKTRLRSRN